MANLSLARIMYGTNEEFRATKGISVPAFSSLTAQIGSQDSTKSSPSLEPETLSELFHKVWGSISSKH
jgi:hypothetical protein